MGFAIFTVFSLLLSVTWMTGSEAALWIIVMRLGQGVGGALLFANSSAILTDAWPEDERGKAMGINGIALVTGSFIGLDPGRRACSDRMALRLLGVGAIRALRDAVGLPQARGQRRAPGLEIDWWGNATFAIGLIAVLVGIVYGLLPYGGHSMGWTSPFVLTMVFGGLAVLIVFVIIELRVENPMFQLQLFRVRAYSAGIVASFLSALGRGGLQFMLIIWLQGIWLPQHGYDFARTPLWAGIAMIPLTLGFLISGPISGILADRYGARGIATVGLTGSALCYLLLETLPMNFDYPEFAVILFVFSLFAGMFFTPNQTAVMNSLPPNQRGAGAGMNATFINSAQVLSIGVFFSIVTLGLVSTLPTHLANGLIAQGVPAAQAHKVANLPPIGTLFAAFLGFNPIQTEVPHQVLAHLGPAHVHYLTGRSFFPQLISSSFEHGLRLAFDFAAGITLLAAIVSWCRGKKYIHAEQELGDEVGFGLLEVGEVAAAEVGAGYIDS